MRITFVLKHADLAGGVRVIAAHADALARRGLQVLVVSTPHPLPRLRFVAKSLALRGRFPPLTRISPSHLDGLDATLVQHKVLDRDRPVTDADLPDADVVIATWWETAEWVSRLSPSKGTKCSFLQHFEAHDPATADRATETWRLPFHKIAVSRWLADLASQRFGDTEVSLVPNGVDTELFSAPSRMRGIPPTVGFVYSAAPFKRADLALDTFSQLRERIPLVRLLAFGSQPQGKGDLPPDAEFYPTPPQDSLRSIYSRCDAWLCTSDTEGFGLPLLEAMACRTPVVSTRSGGPEDFVEDGINGFLVDIGDVNGLVDRVQKLLTCSPTTWRTMSRRAHGTAALHQWDNAYILFEQALYRAIERASRGEIAGRSEGFADLNRRAGRTS
jgi:glycosyltransferase involved in cell wall biosynthesis